MKLHNQASTEESGFMDRWEYLQWRAILAGIKATSDTNTVKFQAPEKDEMLFTRLTGFLSAVQWLQGRDVNLPGIEGFPRGEGDWHENDYHYQAGMVE